MLHLTWMCIRAQCYTSSQLVCKCCECCGDSGFVGINIRWSVKFEAHLVFHTDRTRFVASEGQGWDEFMALPKRFS